MKTKVIQIKEGDWTETFYLHNGKVNLKGFQANFETFFFLHRDVLLKKKKLKKGR